jgi:hypothetical protein
MNYFVRIDTGAGVVDVPVTMDMVTDLPAENKEEGVTLLHVALALFVWAKCHMHQPMYTLPDLWTTDALIGKIGKWASIKEVLGLFEVRQIV